MSNVVYLSTHPRFPVKASDYDELTLGNAQSVMDYNDAQTRKQLCSLARVEGEQRVIAVLRAEASALMDLSRQSRAQGREADGKTQETVAVHLLSLVASLPTKLRGQ